MMQFIKRLSALGKFSANTVIEIELRSYWR